MKTRKGFVSNSSSSSFVVGKSKLNDIQIYLLLHHRELCEKVNFPYYDCDFWQIKDEGDFIYGYTIMDNLDMDEFMKQIGINKEDVKWMDY